MIDLRFKILLKCTVMVNEFRFILNKSEIVAYLPDSMREKFIIETNIRNYCFLTV